LGLLAKVIFVKSENHNRYFMLYLDNQQICIFVLIVINTFLIL